MSERRRFSRVIYQAPAELHQGQLKVSSSIKDLSLHGLLLATPDTPLDSAHPVDVFFQIPDSDIIISLQADIVEMTDTFIRVSIQHIDIDSISHLRRLVELNVGDDELLHRELEQLSDLGDHH
ncbi:pilus protein PilZ [Vibrio sp. MACH09]|uniref:PilZ domain-containing protein n=1 Tax=unclassified Vibrio TaxID=2614977 RepID=UPI001493A595|nr:MULTISPECIES: PilZ domain-containing protein [unclassified Vibrio]NOI67261.1 PilZ domain-containing protein [Vibrio sp. 99-8-1]GLO59977.1 pilus protein PilZ [Vibrio sp. MACH09]